MFKFLEMSRQLLYTTTPIIELKSPALAVSSVRILVKREDQNHVHASGNKWWKLKYNLNEAIRLGHNTLLTFGGAYSNHIYATAATAKELGVKSIGIIRGEEVQPLNHTLAFAASCGMKLHFVSRDEYRSKTDDAFIQKLYEQFGDFYLIPEGGTNELAVNGVAEFGSGLINEAEFDYICLPVGTGGTIAGIVRGMNGNKKILGFSVLKGGSFLNDEVKRWVGGSIDNWSIVEDYHFGGYAKTTNELLNFMTDFEKQHQVPLDQVYTAKLVFGVFDMIQKGYFKKESTILILHTGGLQGRVTS
jgi:1-aminocyclopropane-1-carboxylate deaminase